MDELVDEDIYEQVKKHDEQQANELQEEQITIEEPPTSPAQQNAQQNTTEQVVIEEPQPEEYEQFLDSVDWMTLQELKPACLARKLHCSGSKKDLVKRLDDYNQKVEIARTKPFIDRKRYKFHVTIHGDKCYRVISVPRDCALSFLVYTALHSFNFDTDEDFKMDVVNHPEIDCIPEALIYELELVDGDVLRVEYDNWLICLMLMYNDVLDRREGTALLKVNGEAPKQTDQPETTQGTKRTKKQGNSNKKKTKLAH